MRALALFVLLAVCASLSAPVRPVRIGSSEDRDRAAQSASERADRQHKTNLTLIVTIGAGATIITSAWLLSRRKP